MAKSKMAFAVSGVDRAEHEAAIAMRANAWQGYQELHQQAFADANLNKFQMIANSDGAVLQAANDTAELVANASGTVRHEDFLVIQQKITEVRRRKLNGITDLMDMGLTFNVALSEQLVGFENVNEFQDAEQEMNPNSYQNNDTVFTDIYTPNPITHQSFTVPWRQQGFDYKRGQGLSETVRQVSERLEQTLFNGNTGIVVNFGAANHPIYGYTTHPNRGIGAISDWTVPANNDLIIPELIEQIGLMWANQGGVGNDSVTVYLANDIWTVFQNDYKAGVKGSIMDRALEIAQVKAIKPAEKLASTQVMLVEMDERTIQLAVASDIISIPHTKTNPMQPQVMTTYAAMVQQIKSDSNGNTGIRHLTV